MNLALQKRNEQLERWRQHEALIQKQLDEEREGNNNNNNGLNATNKFNNSLHKSKTTDISLLRYKQADDDNDLDSNRKRTHRRKGRLQNSDDLKVKFTSSTLFLTACANDDLNECERLLNDNLVDIDVTTPDGLTGLHEAAICGNINMVEFLLERGANINCCDNEGWTPLHAAASLGQIKIVETLLNHNADVTIVNCENFLAYDLARNEEVQNLIGEKLKGIDIDQLHSQEELAIQRDIDRWIQTGHYDERSHPITNATALHVLAAKGYIKLMKQILENPALKTQLDLEAKDNEGFTPLLAASFWNQTEIVELLIEHNANIFAEAKNGYKISSIHLKNYQQSKLSQQQQQQQQQPTSPTSRTRSSVQSLDLDETEEAASKRSNISLDSIATDTSSRDVGESLGDIVPSGSASKYVREGRLHKSHSLEIGNKQPMDTTTLLTSSMSVDRLLLRAESMGERDLRKSFKELVMENERLKRQLMSIDEQDKQKQQDWIRTERQLQRKISELEEENKQLEHWKQEIQRLKDENSSLIRVVSKLSKQS